MDPTVTCVARWGVLADRRYRPGETLELSKADLDALEASGAVERAPDPEPPKRSPPPAPPGPTGTREEEAGGGDNADSRPTTFVRGIGPKTAEQLAALNIRTLADLASITSEEGLARVAGAIDVIGNELKAVVRWRDEARVLVESGTIGE